MEVTGIILPSDAAKDELRALGLDVDDPEENERARRAYASELTRLMRLVAAGVCGMTSAPPDRDYRGEVTWMGGFPPMPVVRRVRGVEVALEMHLWGRWLFNALQLGAPLSAVAERMPPPPPRPFMAPVWPDLGLGPDPRVRRASRRGRARRS